MPAERDKPEPATVCLSSLPKTRAPDRAGVWYQRKEVERKEKKMEQEFVYAVVEDLTDEGTAPECLSDIYQCY
jgi:hypothetical protein